MHFTYVLSVLRLVGGLASEKVRWAESVQEFRKEELTLAGDVLLTSSYLSYVGCFSRSYRLDMLENKWMPFFNALDVRMCMFNMYIRSGTIDVQSRREYTVLLLSVGMYTLIDCMYIA